MDFRRVLAGVALVAMVACGGGGDSGTTPINQPPTVAFTFTPLATPQSIPVDLTITATDPDGDPLTITWKITRGTLAAQNSKKTVMRWTPPATLGADTVNVSVSDGATTRKLSEAIKVGYAWTGGSNAPPVFQKSKSPYIVTLNVADPRLTIDDGATTTIEPGTEILFNTAGSFIEVLGTLDAHGTADEPIILRQNNRTFKCGAANGGRWEGIQVRHDSGVPSAGVLDLEHVELWFPRNGVRLFDDSTADLNNVSVRCSGNAGLLMEGSGYVRALDSSFTDGDGDGIAVAAFSSLPDSVRIERCTLSFNQGSGIRMDIDDAVNAVPIIVEHNDIEFNSTHGISLAHAVFPQIHFNTFRGNGDSSVSSLYLQSGYPTVAFPELDATCNFWGAASSSQATIDVGIHDELDQSTVHTRVKSCPWLNSVPPPTMTNCSMSCP